MKDSNTIIATLDRAIEYVDAIETLGASLAAGMHAGVVIPDHVQTLMTTMATQIREQLAELARCFKGGRASGRKVMVRVTSLATNGWLHRKRVILVTMATEIHISIVKTMHCDTRG